MSWVTDWPILSKTQQPSAKNLWMLGKLKIQRKTKVWIVAVTQVGGFLNFPGTSFTVGFESFPGSGFSVWFESYCSSSIHPKAGSKKCKRDCKTLNVYVGNGRVRSQRGGLVDNFVTHRVK